MENFIAPLGPMIISSIAKKEGHKTYLCEINNENPLEKIRQIKPDMIA
jgi:hypothetical protein